MRYPAGKLALTPKTRRKLGLFHKAGTQRLNRDAPAEVDVVGFIDLAHAAYADQADDSKTAPQKISRVKGRWFVDVTEQQIADRGSSEQVVTGIKRSEKLFDLTT